MTQSKLVTHAEAASNAQRLSQFRCFLISECFQSRDINSRVTYSCRDLIPKMDIYMRNGCVFRR
jgi:hypothetical protein